MSEQFKIYIFSPKHHISEQTIRKFINSVNMTANDLFDGNVYDFDLEQSIKKQCNYKRVILDFLKFMEMGNPLMEIMIDEFLEEVYDGDNDE